MVFPRGTKIVRLLGDNAVWDMGLARFVVLRDETGIERGIWWV